jgi:hypothetical protein
MFSRQGRKWYNKCQGRMGSSPQPILGFDSHDSTDWVLCTGQVHSLSRSHLKFSFPPLPLSPSFLLSQNPVACTD